MTTFAPASRPVAGAPVGRNCRVALLGLGTVGLAVARRLLGPRGLAHAAGLTLVAVAVARPERPQTRQALLTLLEESAATQTSVLPTLTRPLTLAEVSALTEVDILLDATGGGADVAEVLAQALSRGVDVVTANKALLSRWGPGVFAAAAAPGAGRLAFEAAVGGGIPIIAALRRYFAHDPPTTVAGILNGTSNYILGRIAAQVDFQSALDEAIARGYAEPGGGADVSGEDALHKILLLCRLAFGVELDPDGPPRRGVRGIAGLEALDFRYASQRLGREIRSLAVAQRRPPSGAVATPAALALRVGPVLLPAESIFRDVRGSHNAVVLACPQAGHYLLAGPGAGGPPTAHAMLADLLDLASRRGHPRRAGLPDPVLAPCRAAPDSPAVTLLAPEDHHPSLLYVRFVVRNGPGIVGAIAEAFGRAGLHIHEVLQLDHARAELASMTALREGLPRAVVEAGDALAFAVTVNSCRMGDAACVVEQLACSARFANLCPPVMIPAEDDLPDPCPPV